MVNAKDTTPTLIPFALRQLGAEAVNTVDARDLHEFLEVKTQYSDWIARRIITYGFVQDIDFAVLISEYGPTKTIEYHVSLAMAKELSMVERTKKGKEARQYFLACEKAAQESPRTLQLHNPMSQVMIDMVVRVDTLEYEVAEGKVAMARVETKADMAIEEMHRLTLEEFILENGLLRQFPEAQWPSYVKWLKDFCLSLGMDVRKGPVYGKRWDGENTYPIKALTAWRQYELHKPRQVTLVPS